MNLLRIICLLSICCFLGAAQEVPLVPSQHPEQISGRWETITSSGIEGIGVEIVSALKGPSLVWQNVSVRVYTRESGKEKWGYFAAQYRQKPESYPLPDPTSFEVFDGRHLRIHFTDTTDIKPFDLNIVFVPKSKQWIGTWSRNGKDEPVMLTRPVGSGNAKFSKFVGEWIGEPSSDPADPFEPLLSTSASQPTVCFPPGSTGHPPPPVFRAERFTAIRATVSTSTSSQLQTQSWY